MKHSPWPKSGSYSFTTSLYAGNRLNDSIMAYKKSIGTKMNDLDLCV